MPGQAETDSARVEVLHSYGVLDTPAEPDFDRLSALAARICGTPMALVSLVDADRQWFKSVHCIALESTPREISFCSHAIGQRELFVVEDATLDPRFAGNPLVLGAPFVRFYAGMPLLAPDGVALGALAVIDRVPRRLDALQVETLQTLAAQVMALLESRRQRHALEAALLERGRSEATLRQSESRWRLLFDRNPLSMWVYDRETLRFLAVNDAAVVGYGWSYGEFMAMTIKDLRLAEDLPVLLNTLATVDGAFHSGQPLRHRLKNGRVIHVDLTAHSVPYEGRPARLVLAHDVTDRVLATRALADSEAGWQRLFAASATGITTATPAGRFLSANPAFCSLLGRSEAEVQQLDLLEITHPDDRAGCDLQLQRLLAGEIDSIAVDKRFQRPDGSSVWARSAISLMRDPATQQMQLVAVVQDIDAQMRAQVKLQQSHALIALAGRMAGLGGWAVDLPDEAVRWSDELLAILDCPPEYRPGVEETMAWYEPASRLAVAGAMAACRDDGTPFDLELEMTTPRQRRLAVRVIGEAVRDADGRIVRLQGALHDQSERLRHLAALRLSEERFRSVARATADALWDWDLRDDTRWWSDGMQQLFGYLPGELEPTIESWLRRIHPDDLERVEAGIRAVIAGAGDGEHWSSEYRFRHRAGRYAAVVDRGFVIRDAAGTALRMVGGMNDVSAQRDAAERLRWQAALLDAAQDAIVVRNLDDAVIYWNRGAEQVFGWSAGEAMGRRVAELLREDPLAAAGVRTELLARGEWTATLEHRRKDGSAVMVDGRWKLLRDGQGQPRAILAIKTDVTERLRLEVQLQQAQRLEAVGQLTGGIAHDFNNLLTVILGSADLLIQRLADAPQLLELVEMTRSAAERGAELTHRLLAFARKQPLQPQAVDAHQLVAGMDALLRHTLPANIELELVRAAGLWPARVDPTQLESALLNLVLNSRDAMPQGGKLTLETVNAWVDQDYADRHADVLPGQYVMLSVSDTGIGMAPGQLARAFEPFFTTKGKGSGLGLSMVYGFVKQSHGHVKLDSEPGQGTTVRLYLPRADGAAAAAGAGAAVPRQPHDFRGKACVLVVEDDPLVRRHAQDVLTGLGYRVLAAESGDAALQLLAANVDVDLLFTDVMMPGSLDGRQLADAALALRPQLKVLFTSGYSENAIIHHGRLDRGVQLLAKPYRSVDLARKVHALLAAGPVA